MYQFVVHGSHLMQFARAIGDTSPAFGDVDRLTRTGADALAAPPTFLMAADHFDPTYARRPLPGVPWVGSQPRNSNQQAGFHMEQHFVFRRPVRAGDVLTADSRPGSAWEKRGRRAGIMTFTEILTDYRDAEGALVATAHWISAMVERKPASAAPFPSADSPASVCDLTELVDLGDSIPCTGDLAVGDTWYTVLVENLTRTQLVMYAGASGDFHPLHSDDVYARDRGFPGVFAHGMLTMGMTGRAITDRFGHAGVRSFGGRIVSQVWPGDTLTTQSTVVGLRESGDGGTVATLTLVTVDRTGARVFSGRAEVLLD